MLQYVGFAGADEPRDTVGLDVLLGREAQLSLYGYLNQEPLAVKAVLLALRLSQHGVVALPEILVRPAPGVMYSHRPVGRYWPIHERETLVGVCVPAENWENED